MIKNKIKKKIKDLLISHFKLKKKIPKFLSSDNIENWDSVNHLSLITKMEEKFHIKFNEEAYTLLDEKKILKKILENKNL